MSLSLILCFHVGLKRLHNPLLGLSCVLMGQVARILAFNFPKISKEDIIMTADTDLFPVDQDFLTPLGNR